MLTVHLRVYFSCYATSWKPIAIFPGNDDTVFNLMLNIELFSNYF